MVNQHRSGMTSAESAYRRVKVLADGNCFYHALIVSASAQGRWPPAREALHKMTDRVAHAVKTDPRLICLRPVMDALGPLSADFFSTKMLGERGASRALVQWCRIAVVAELVGNEYFHKFVAQPDPVCDFLRHARMGHFADHLHVQALAIVTDISIYVYDTVRNRAVKVPSGESPARRDSRDSRDSRDKSQRVWVMFNPDVRHYDAMVRC